MGSAGFPASVEAVAVCAAKGINIGDHRNQGLSKSLVDESDFIFVMERVHRDIIINFQPEAENRCFLLAGDEDIPDPMGYPQRKYESCAKLIEKAIKERINGLAI
jgi:protein-tyrosine-phosphatase